LPHFRPADGWSNCIQRQAEKKIKVETWQPKNDWRSLASNKKERNRRNWCFPPDGPFGVPKDERKYYEVEKRIFDFVLDEDKTPNAVGLPPLSNRTFLVTGSTGGIGERTARQLLHRGAQVILHGRDPATIRDLMDRIAKTCPQARYRAFSADLQTMEEAKEFAAAISASFPVIHGILHNAATADGDYTGKRATTFGDMNEYTMAVNAYAPMAITRGLMKNLAASGAGRVIFSGSTSMAMTEQLEDLEMEQTWSGLGAYRLSKLVNAMTTAELDARYGDAPRLTFHAINPGVFNTKLYRQLRIDSTGPRKRRHHQRIIQGYAPNVRSSNASFDALVSDRFQETSGINLASDREDVSNAKLRAKLWRRLEERSQTDWPELSEMEKEDTPDLELEEITRFDLKPHMKFM
jgi:NAD(P)-dependent dehydrogenase (short-subunit alcohol dehydrogenase family)